MPSSRPEGVRKIAIEHAVMRPDSKWHQSMPALSPISVGSPAAIHGQRDTGDRGRRIADEKEGQRAELLDRSEALVRLLSQQHVTYVLPRWGGISGLSVSPDATA